MYTQHVSAACQDGFLVFLIESRVNLHTREAVCNVRHWELQFIYWSTKPSARIINPVDLCYQLRLPEHN